jgi:hypothetical protein
VGQRCMWHSGTSPNDAANSRAAVPLRAPMLSHLHFVGHEPSQTTFPGGPKQHAAPESLPSIISKRRWKRTQAMSKTQQTWVSQGPKINNSCRTFCDMLIAQILDTTPPHSCKTLVQLSPAEKCSRVDDLPFEEGKLAGPDAEHRGGGLRRIGLYSGALTLRPCQQAQLRVRAAATHKLKDSVVFVANHDVRGD